MYKILDMFYGFFSFYIHVYELCKQNFLPNQNVLFKFSVGLYSEIKIPQGSYLRHFYLKNLIVIQYCLK